MELVANRSSSALTTAATTTSVAVAGGPMIQLGRDMVEDPTVKKLRYVAEVWLTVPLVAFGVLGNLVSFMVLCHHRRQKLQTTTTLLQVWRATGVRDDVIRSD